MIRLCVIMNPSFGLTLAFEGRWEYLMQRGFLCAAIAGPGPEHHELRRRVVTTWEVPIERYPSPWKDLVSLTRIWLCLMRHRFDIVDVSTPKASLLGALAARLSGHSRIVYMVLGRPYENMTGLKRKLMNACEWLTCSLAMVVVPISHELGAMLVAERLCPARKMRVIGVGTNKGVNLDRFTRTKERIEQGREIRRQVGIADDDLVILFVGWLRRDKGVNELTRAFCQLAEQYPGLHLITLGNFEPSDPVEPDVEHTLRTHPRIHRLEWRPEPVPVFAAADMVASPSYREGFGNVALEASAMELAVVASDIPGCREGVVRDVTGLLVPKGDSKALAAALKRLIDDPGLRQSLARNGRARIERDFCQEKIWEGQLRLYREVAGE